VRGALARLQQRLVMRRQQRLVIRPLDGNDAEVDPLHSRRSMSRVVLQGLAPMKAGRIQSARPFNEYDTISPFSPRRLPMWNLRKLKKKVRPSNLRRQIFFNYRLPSLCKIEEVNVEAFDRIAVFRKSKIAFNRLKKNANSTVMIALTRLENGLLLNSTLTAKREASGLDDASVLFADLAHFDWLLIVRDPYSRTLSAFLEKFQKELYIRRYGKFELSSIGFLNFLCWLKDGGMSADFHWNLQTAHIFLPMSFYTRIIRFETFGSEFLRFLQEKDPAIDSDFLSEATSIGAIHATRSDEKVNAFYNTESKKLVSELFEADFRALGYPFKD
jgi:Sulfotransferase family